MERLGVGDELAVALDPVLVPEAGAADVDAPHMDREHVVEDRCDAVVDPHARRQRLDPVRSDRPVAARVLCEIRDARHLEPDEVGGVVGDSLGVGLREAHPDLADAVEPFRHRATIRAAATAPQWYDWDMPEATTTTKDDRDMIARLADRGEQTIARLADLPGGTKALKAANDLRARVDELGKKVRGIDALEQRVAKLEQELATLKRAPKAKAAPKPPA
jgi:hypothetical protein